MEFDFYLHRLLVPELISLEKVGPLSTSLSLTSRSGCMHAQF